MTADRIDDELWSAVGDPTRRRMLDLLLVGKPATATTLSAQLPISRQAVAKHLGVLDRAGLVSVTPAGREKHYRLDDEQFAKALAQLNAVSDAWGGRLQRIKRLAEAVQRTTRERRSPTDAAYGVDASPTRRRRPAHGRDEK